MFFVVIASLLLLTPINWIGTYSLPWLGSLLAAAVAWGLTEFFVRKRRMALPAIVLLLAFISYVFYAVFSATATIPTDHNWDKGFNMPINYILPAIISTVAAYLHWLRFKVPITVVAGTAALVGGVLVTLLSSPSTKDFVIIASIIAGITVFAYAMRWDALDTNRQTRKSDVGFWLHLLAAPLIVHPIFELLGVLHNNIGVAQVLVVLVLYITIAIISLLIDRRALMVSALGYVVYVFSMLVNDMGDVGLGFAITAFAIGSALLILSAFWHKCRGFLLRFTPAILKPYLPQ